MAAPRRSSKVRGNRRILRLNTPVVNKSRLGVGRLQPPAESGPRRWRKGRTSPRSSGLRPVSSATISSTSFIRPASALSASATGSGRWAQSASGPVGRLPSTRTGCPGLPTTVAFWGTSWITTELAPILAWSPTLIGPSSLAPEPMTTSSPTLGWRLPRWKPVPPSVTPWYSVTSSPISAVSPITTPEPWSMKRPGPIVAAGWISTPVAARTKVATVRGTSGTPAPCRAWARRWASSACTPGHVARISLRPTPRAAGSRSRAAATSRLTSLTTRATVPSPSMRRSLRTEERHRDVALSGVGEHRDDPLAARLGTPRELACRPHVRPARDAAEDALDAREVERSVDRVLVAHGDDLVEQVAVEHRRDEAGADPIDAMRPWCAAREHRGAAGRARDDPARGVALLEPLAGPGDRPARPDAGDERVDAVERLQDLGPRRAAVRLGVGRVLELARHPDVVVRGHPARLLDGLVH